MKKNIVIMVLLVFILAFTVWSRITTPKIVYLDTYKVLENYEGIKEARELYETKLLSLQQAIDSLNNQIEATVNLLQDGNANLDEKQKDTLIKGVQRKQYDKQKLEVEAERLISEEGLNLTQGLIERVNEYIDKYSTEHNIDLVLSNPEDGTILHCSDKLNITDKVIEGLNAEFLGNE